MKTMKFKTSIKCSGCVEKVTPYLDKAVGKDHWSVDMQSADKILTVESEQADKDSVVQAMEEAGYKAAEVA